MNYEKLGMIATVIILGSLLCASAVSSGSVNIPGTDELSKSYGPFTSSTKNTPQSEGYWQYCYKMNIEC